MKLAAMMGVPALLGAASLAKAVEPVAPVVGDPGDVIIGDLTAATDPSSLNTFVFPDAFSLGSIVLDGDTPDSGILWSFTAADTKYSINGVGPLATLGDATNPPTGSQINANDNDPAQLDNNPQTVTFRNQDLSPIGGPNVDPGAAGIIASETRAVTLFASDGSSVTARTITVFSANDAEDSISGGGPLPEVIADFAVDGASGWTGLDSNNASLPGSGTATLTSQGLCMNVPASGDNQVLWVSPEDYVPLVDLNVYRARATMATDQTDPDSIPFWSFMFDNYHTSGMGNVYNGETMVLDVDGGANGIGRPQGRGEFEFWFGPNSMQLPQWRGSIDFANSAFSPANEPYNDMRLSFRVNDLGSGMINADADSGSVCVSALSVYRISLSLLSVEATVWNPPLNTATHFAQSFEQEAQALGTATIDNVQAIASYQIPSPTVGSSVRKTLGPFDQATFDPNDPLAYGPLYPIAWNTNELLIGRSSIHSTTSSADPIDVISSVFNTTNFELGQTQTSWRGAPGNFHLAASPRTAAEAASQEYVSFFYTNNQTVSTTPNAANLRFLMDFFNTNFIGVDGTGDSPFQVESMSVDRLSQPAE